MTAPGAEAYSRAPSMPHLDQSTRAIMRFLFLGDVVGPPGVAFVRRALPLWWRTRSGSIAWWPTRENAHNGPA